MAQAYTPGLKVAARVLHRCRRILPLPGEVLVRPGQRVAARDIAAQTLMPGDVTPVNVANLLSISPGEVPACLLKREGESIDVGEPLARSKGIFGFFQAECASPVRGVVESISPVTGQVMLRGQPHPVQVLAYLAGEVVEVLPSAGVVIEAPVTFVQGIFGIGGEAFGPIRMACRTRDEFFTPQHVKPEMRGAVVVAGTRATAEGIARAREVGVAALIAGGIDDQDLRDVLGYDLGVATTGSEQVGLTLIVTEGFGDIAMAERTFRLFSERAGAEAAVNGATQIRAGVLRPEVLIPWGDESGAAGAAPELPGGTLVPGAPVRIIRDPHFGIIGAVAALPPEPQVLASGSRARVLEVALATGERVIVPRANVELIEE